MSKISPIKTGRLLIREFKTLDWMAVHSYASDQETVRFMDWGPNTEADTKAFVRRAVREQSSRPRTHYDLAVTLVTTGELIGGCAFESYPARKEGDIGYCLNKAHWDEGYGTEVAKALIEFGFTRLGVHRIGARCDPYNVGSNRVLVKAGMTLEGHLREDFPIRGKWHDTMVYGILEREWNSSRRVRPG